MNRTDGRTLAWALADSANESMNPADHTAVCTNIGAGEHDSAIRYILFFYANTGTALPFVLAAPIRKWIDGYTGSDSEQTLRHAYDQIRVSAEDAASSEAIEAEPDCAPKRLVAKRSEHATRACYIRHAPHTASRIVLFGVTMCIEELVYAAVEARRVARTATEVAVREARSMNWSWERIAEALGGNPDPELLRRKFG